MKGRFSVEDLFTSHEKEYTLSPPVVAFLRAQMICGYKLRVCFPIQNKKDRCPRHDKNLLEPGHDITDRDLARFLRAWLRKADCALAKNGCCCVTQQQLVTIYETNTSAKVKKRGQVEYPKAKDFSALAKIVDVIENRVRCVQTCVSCVCRGLFCGNTGGLYTYVQNRAVGVWVCGCVGV